MALLVSAPLADSLWSGMLLFIALILLGICILFVYFVLYLGCNKENRSKLEDYNCIFNKKGEIIILWFLLSAVPILSRV